MRRPGRRRHRTPRAPPSEPARRRRARSTREREDPPCTRQSPLTLATFRSWGIHWMTPHEGPRQSVPDSEPDAAPRLRAPGGRDRCHRPHPPHGWPRGARVAYSSVPLHGTIRGRVSAWRIRLVAYGARLESVLGASPRGFESPILRRTEGPSPAAMRVADPSSFPGRRSAERRGGSLARRSSSQRAALSTSVRRTDRTRHLEPRCAPPAMLAPWERVERVVSCSPSACSLAVRPGRARPARFRPPGPTGRTHLVLRPGAAG